MAINSALMRTNPKIVVVGVIVLVIGSLGAIWQVASHAAVTNLAIEAETGTLTGGAIKVGDNAASGGSAVRFGMSQPTTYLVNDQFDGNTLDPKLWVAKSYPKGYRNHEEQDYLPSQVTVANGVMQIVASRDSSGAWHSGEVESLWNYPYGSFQVRIKVSGAGPGVWPADWMMGRNGQWPTNGEIDTMEEINGAALIYGTIHGPGSNGNWQSQKKVSPIDISQYHVYRIDKTPNDIKWYIDNVLTGEWRPTDAPPGATWPFENNTFYGLLNIAIGGNWPGASTAATPNPVVMSVDWYTVSKL